MKIRKSNQACSVGFPQQYNFTRDLINALTVHETVSARIGKTYVSAQIAVNHVVSIAADNTIISAEVIDCICASATNIGGETDGFSFMKMERDKICSRQTCGAIV